MSGLVKGKRSTDLRATTQAVRDFLRVGGRILLDPTRSVSEGGAVPKTWLTGADRDRAEVVRASRAYFEMRQRPHADRQLLRIVTMLGRPTHHGWIVMEARP